LPAVIVGFSAVVIGVVAVAVVIAVGGGAKPPSEPTSSVPTAQELASAFAGFQKYLYEFVT